MRGVFAQTDEPEYGLDEGEPTREWEEESMSNTKWTAEMAARSREFAEEATPLPWHRMMAFVYDGPTSAAQCVFQCHTGLGEPQSRANARYATHACNVLPAAVERIEELERTVAEMERHVAHLQRSLDEARLERDVLKQALAVQTEPRQ